MNWLIGIFAFASAASLNAADATIEQSGLSLRPWDAKASVERRRVAIGGGNLNLFETEPALDWSPDGKRFFVIVGHGNLQSDENDYELDVFDVDGVAAALGRPASVSVAPIARLKRSSYDGRWPIQSPAWTSGGDAITYTCFNREIKTLCSFDIATEADHVTPMAPSGEFYGWASYHGHVPGDDRALYMLAEESHREAQILDAYPAAFAGVEDLKRATTPHLIRNTYALILAKPNLTTQRLMTLCFNTEIVSKNAFSPTGEYAVALACSPQHPLSAAWQGKLQMSGDRQRAETGFFLIDTRAGNVSRILDAPTGLELPVPIGFYSSSYYGGMPTWNWSPDGTHVMLVNTALPPVDGVVDGLGHVVDFDVERHRWKDLGLFRDDRDRRRVSHVTWRGDHRAVVVYEPLHQSGSGDSTPAEARAAQSAAKKGVMVFIEQDANTPQTVVASNGRHSINLLPPDVALAGVQLLPSKTVTWSEPSGGRGEGGLILPLNYAGNRLPLVIQAYRYNPRFFQPEGTASTTFAAQPLAAAGMAVLQIDSIHDEAPNPGGRFVARLDAAVAFLESQGLIDPERVGLVGFSASAERAFYAITHPGSKHLQAVIAADGWGGSYEDYLWFGDSEREQEINFDVRGSFWENKASWLARANSFNMDRVTTPTMLTANLDSGFTDSLPLVFLRVREFELSGRPVEMQIFPKGIHPLSRPRERLVSMQTTVDWMRFWLQDRAPPDQATSARWLAMKARWEQLRGQHAVGESRARAEVAFPQLQKLETPTL